jgi:hypothetical protein
MVGISKALVFAASIGTSMGAVVDMKASEVLPAASASNTFSASSTPSQEAGKGNQTEVYGEAWILQKKQEIFGRPLNKKEYYKRNWMWIRCRNKSGFHYDVGGSWFGQNGTDYRDAVMTEACITDFKLTYVNGQDWGDATVKFSIIGTDYCHQDWPVLQAVELARKAGENYKRELYIWNCPNFENYPNFGHEWPGKRLPTEEFLNNPPPTEEQKETGETSALGLMGGMVDG